MNPHDNKVNLWFTSISFGLLLLSIFIAHPQRNAGHPIENATTIRNATKDTVIFWITPHKSSSSPEEYHLLPGCIYRHLGDQALDISFRRGEKRVTYKIAPGAPYSFRPDEFHQLELYEGAHGRPDAVDLAPYVQTPMPVVEKMLKLAGVNESDVLYDLGCGDGRIVITAAKLYGTHGVGIDIMPERIQESLVSARDSGVDELVEFKVGDATKMDFSSATVITLYLIPESNELLRPLLEEQLKPGTRVVSHNYPIPGWEKKLVSSVEVLADLHDTRFLYLYRR